MMPAAETVEPEALVRYLRDLAQLRTRPILRVDDYEFVMWFDQVPDHRSCQSVIDGHHWESSEWLTIDRVDLPRHPEPPTSTLEWLNPAELDRPSSEPNLQTAITRVQHVDTGDGPKAVTTKHLLEDHPTIQRAWESYLPRWREWAALRRELDPVHELYTELFRAAERTRQVGEQYETLVAVGLATHKGERGAVRRHLLTAPAQITLDAESGRISVEPADETKVGIRLEQDMFVPDETPPADVQNAVRTQLEGLDPLDLDAVSDVLATWTHGASADATFEPDLTPGMGVTDEFHVRLAPALIMRPRSQQALVDTYDSILHDIREGAAVPATFGDLTTTSSTPITTEERSASGLDASSSEQWFPLPANDEQAQIVRALGSRRGVIVHGPPGTGKSHTIANLISHALATGRRVLVTAHSARALEVLSEKLPDDIRSLTVTMLGQGRRGTDDLERSANEILRRRQDPGWSPPVIRERLTRLNERLAANRAVRQRLLAQLAEVRSSEAEPIDLGFGGYEGTLAELASRIASEPPAPEWLTVKPEGPPPCSDADLEELISLASQLTGEDLELADAVLPDPSALPEPDRLARALSSLSAATERVQEYSDITADLLALFEDLDEAALTEYVVAARELQVVQDSIDQRQAPWLQTVLADFGRGQWTTWQAVRQSTSEYLAAPRDLGVIDRLEVTLPDPTRRAALRTQATTLLEFLRSGGKIRVIKAKAVKAADELLATVTVNGARPDTAEACEAFIRWCDENAEVALLERGWPSGSLSHQPTLVLRHAVLTDALQALHECFHLVDRKRRLSEVIARHDIDPDLLPADPRLVTRAAEASEAHAEMMGAREVLDTLLQHVRIATEDPQMHPVALVLRVAAEERHVSRYSKGWNRLARLSAVAAVVDAYLIRLGVLGAVLPAVANLVRQGHGDQIRCFEAEWNRARGRAWLESHERVDANVLVEKIGAIDELTRDLVTEIGGRRAWLHAIDRLSDAHTQHLKGYQTAMKRVGKGTGKYAPKHRAEARVHLAKCQDAVPAWVMPAHQVAANVSAEPGSFDLVIVDEASQSGVEELFLFWLGKQVVVVGDKQQISPDGSFVKGEAQALQRRHLEGWSFAGEFGPENSLFDVAEVKYVAGEVWLSEHFRSMPEIIEYSNQLCYADHRLEPVRQFGSDRLPPLCSTLVPHVPGGTGGSKRINRDEADALVSQLLGCLDDPDYVYADGTPLTFGVISLLGTDQAKLIQQRLLELVDPEVWMERRIHVGDASDFQGDERDVIFLSMVTTPPDDGRRIPKLGHDRDLRRFNVAASRARDQLWLFHSVEHHQLNPECPRARLIAHIANPTRAGLDGYEGTVDPNELRSPFESLFEQRVFLDLVNRGYVVVPQWTILGYRIDLVVVGADARLAVECDGDAWHGPDAYAADLARQRDLERVGWRFVRIKEWEYYADKVRSLEPLWQALEELGVGRPDASAQEWSAGATPVSSADSVAGSDLLPPPFAGTPPATPESSAVPRLPYGASFFASQRHVLLGERALLVQHLNDLDSRATRPGSPTEDREPVAARRQAITDTVGEIDAALVRIDRGVYGVCEFSGKPIPRDRLEALPWAKERIEYKIRRPARMPPSD